ncbi:hypothetical protein FHG87_021019 [Trinorchestia longiramus]|nr:hypothetical protein FHG87_021019 [Trinorchestia longiramus]
MEGDREYNRGGERETRERGRERETRERGRERETREREREGNKGEGEGSISQNLGLSVLGNFGARTSPLLPPCLPSPLPSAAREWHDFNTSAQLHRQTKLAPINTLLHEHPKRIWTNIEHMHPQLYLHLTLNTCPHNYTYTSHSHKKLDKYHTELSQARKQKHSAPLQQPNTHDTPHRRT